MDSKKKHHKGFYRNHVVKKLFGNGDDKTLRTNKYSHNPKKSAIRAYTDEEKEFAAGMNAVRRGLVTEYPKPNEVGKYFDGVFHALVVKAAREQREALDKAEAVEEQKAS